MRSVQGWDSGRLAVSTLGRAGFITTPMIGGGWPSLVFTCTATKKAAPALLLLQSWAPRIPFNRLTCAWIGSSCGSSATKALSWGYDQYGNRWIQNQLAGTAFGNSNTFLSHKNQITTSGFTYDAAGNLLNDTFHSYTYDAEGRLLTVDGGQGTVVGRTTTTRVGCATMFTSTTTAGRTNGYTTPMAPRKRQ